MLNPEKHPYYEHSEAEWFMAQIMEKWLAALDCLENKSYNQYHDKKQASFYFFECVDDQDVAFNLFDFGSEWARNRGLNYLLGPKGLSSFDGYGFQVEGFEHRQMMTMMNYNLPNYPEICRSVWLFQRLWIGFHPMSRSRIFTLPDKIAEIARRVEERGKFKVQRFKNKADLRQWANRIGQAYNKSFVNNWEYYPLD